MHSAAKVEAVSTPICDFVRRYAASGAVRGHMPGHKGVPLLGFETLDITEIDGADDLQAPEGIIAESEANASRLFGVPTLYAAEGSSQCVRAMLYLACAPSTNGERPLILAGRNAHRVFMSAAALIDFDVAWLPPHPGDAYHSCTVTAADLEGALQGLDRRPRAVYLTSPDYLGHTADIEALAGVCRAHSVPLMIDNAHGAYLKFLPGGTRHPIDLGADICCDSAHKTLPALTGAAYLHLASKGPFADPLRARRAMTLFGSTSPSYLILQSLDAVNRYLSSFEARLSGFIPRLDAMKARLCLDGWTLEGDEPLKLTLAATRRGLTGDALARALMAANILCEFHDQDFVTLMFTPQNAPEDLLRVEKALLGIPAGRPIHSEPPAYAPLRQALTPRQALFAPRVTLPVEACEGRVMAEPCTSCPPAVPIVMCGERIDDAAIARLKYYGVTCLDVVA